MNAENVIYFDSFGVEHILKEIRKFENSLERKMLKERFIEYKHMIQCVDSFVLDLSISC